MFFKQFKLKEFGRNLEFQNERIANLENELRAIKCLVEVLSERAVEKKEKDVTDKYLNKDGFYDYQAYKNRKIGSEEE